MKGIKILLVFLFIIISLALIHGQGFVNLNFENAQIVYDSSYPPYAVYASDAIPGWTAYIGGVPQNDIC